MNNNDIYQAGINTLDSDHKAFIESADEIISRGDYNKDVSHDESGVKITYTSHVTKTPLAKFTIKDGKITAHIHAENIEKYIDQIDELPEVLRDIFLEGVDCEKLISRSECNPDCAGGIEYTLDGKLRQKCRHTNFKVSYHPAYSDHVIRLIRSEHEARTAS